VRSLDRVQWQRGMRWARARPWPVWATAGAVFLLFAVLGAIARGPATAPAAAHSLSDGVERAAGTPATATASATPLPGQPPYPGVAYPTDRVAPRSVTPTPTETAASYANCAAAAAAGVAPIPGGRPGYRPDLDRDGDGIACDAEDGPSSSPTTPRATPTTPTTPTATATASPTPDPTPTPSDSPSPTPDPTTTTDPGTIG
jgi:Excalibur calcium-binding domain